MTPLLSLIIPVFEAEDFIDACLQSVFKQIPDCVEVIVINDGTTDRSIDIVRRAFGDRLQSGQLLLLEQDNKGPGAARNAGIRIASGDYIAFLDSDDVLFDSYFEETIDRLMCCDADIIEFGFKRFCDFGDLPNITYRPLYRFEGIQKLEDVREQVFSAGCWYPSTRIFRKDIFDRFSFPEDTHYEDLMLIPYVYMEDFTVFFINKPLLGYRYNPDSITSKHTKNQWSEMYAFYKSIPADTDSDALKTLKLKTARSLVFFHSELRMPNFPSRKLISEIRSMHLTTTTRGILRFSDWLFFCFPALYILIDTVRVPTKRKFSSLKRRLQ
jgi:glycosyltransferase involved in cell wall biosynthesis